MVLLSTYDIVRYGKVEKYDIHFPSTALDFVYDIVNSELHNMYLLSDYLTFQPTLERSLNQMSATLN